jgi:hypothetical protein
MSMAVRIKQRTADGDCLLPLHITIGAKNLSQLDSLPGLTGGSCKSSEVAPLAVEQVVVLLTAQAPWGYRRADGDRVFSGRW